ncbi:nitroreductase family deazaflavin-dependent oxidoreductase [Tsukamurella spumae]
MSHEELKLDELHDHGGQGASLDNARVRQINAAVATEFRERSGSVGGPFEGRDLLLLTSIGRKSGEPRVNPLGYNTIDGHVYVCASHRGLPTDPGWVHNVRARKEITVELGREVFDALAVELRDGRYDEVFAQLLVESPWYADHQAMTDRVFPVFEIVRAQP